MKLHHIGIVVGSIKERLILYQNFNNKPLSDVDIITDKIQKVKVCFIKTGGVTLELIEPLNNNSPVSAFLRKGGGLYHLCFETKNIREAVRLIKKSGGFVIGKPVSAKAFNGRKIVFAMFRELGLIEFVEASKRQDEEK